MTTPKPKTAPSFMLRKSFQRNSVAAIMEAVGAFYDVPMPILLGKVRSQRYSWARNVGYYFTRLLTGCSSTELGAIFECNHSSVLYGTVRVKDAAEIYPDVAAELQEVRTIIETKIQQTVPETTDH